MLDTTAPSSAALANPARAADDPTAAALEARGLAKRYGDVAALHPLDLAVPPGEIFCLLGANGAGKTTTINLFLGFVEPTAGRASITGLDVQAEPLETKRRLAYIPEQVTLYRNLTGLENLEYFATLATGSRFTSDALLSHLARAGLDEHAAQRRVGTYSKGMRQKVGIAIALAKNAAVLLLDEPTSGLDPKASNEFSELLLMMAAGGAAVLMATHDLFRAKETGTRVGIMKHGRLVDVLHTSDIGHRDLERLYLDHMRD
jgi:ABC-2 type transport system ATP-binding protein